MCPKYLTIPANETGRITKFEGAQLKKFVNLVIDGELDEKALQKKMKVGLLSIRKGLRSNNVMAAIRAEVEARKLLIQAKALVSMSEVLDGAIEDCQHENSHIRNASRRFVQTAAEGTKSAIVNQNNSIQAWDPEQDEQLWERGKKFFEDNSKRIVIETVNHVIEASRDD